MKLHQILLLSLNIIICHASSNSSFSPSEKMTDDIAVEEYEFDMYETEVINKTSTDLDSELSEEFVYDYSDYNQLSDEDEDYLDEDTDEIQSPESYCELSLNSMMIRLTSSLVKDTVHVHLGDDLFFVCEVPKKYLNSQFDWFLNSSIIGVRANSFNIMIDKRMATNHGTLIIQTAFRLVNDSKLHLVQFPVIILDNYVYNPELKYMEYALFKYRSVIMTSSICGVITFFTILLLIILDRISIRKAIGNDTHYLSEELS